MMEGEPPASRVPLTPSSVSGISVDLLSRTRHFSEKGHNQLLPQTMIIKPAETTEEIEDVRRMFREYAETLGVDLCFQGFHAELDGLPGNYSSPGGTMLVAYHGNAPAGCVALRALGRGICEMKRLFVRPRFRGLGLGTQLADKIIASARELDYSTMRLDTLDRLTEAMRLYERLGFRRIPAYYDNPLPGVVYWELNLTDDNGIRTGEVRCDDRTL